MMRPISANTEIVLCHLNSPGIGVVAGIIIGMIREVARP